jgi:hypothetical protein
MPRLPILLPAVAAAVLAAAPARAEILKAEYGISLAGLPLGVAHATAAIEGRRYRLDVQARLTGIASIVSSGRGGGTATGSLATHRPAPFSYALVSGSGREQRTVRMALANGDVRQVEVVPPLEPRVDRVPVAPTHRRGVVDPLSALLMPMMAERPLDPANCNRTLPIFDGAARFDVALSYGGTHRMASRGYTGEVLVCNARYAPISGHRERPATQFMRDNRDIALWLAPIEGTRILVPVRISLRTMVGVAVVELTRWSVDGQRLVRPTADRS